MRSNPVSRWINANKTTAYVGALSAAATAVIAFLSFRREAAEAAAAAAAAVEPDPWTVAEDFVWGGGGGGGGAYVADPSATTPTTSTPVTSTPTYTGQPVTPYVLADPNNPPAGTPSTAVPPLGSPGNPGTGIRPGFDPSAPPDRNVDAPFTAEEWVAHTGYLIDKYLAGADPAADLASDPVYADYPSVRYTPGAGNYASYLEGPVYAQWLAGSQFPLTPEQQALVHYDTPTFRAGVDSFTQPSQYAEMVNILGNLEHSGYVQTPQQAAEYQAAVAYTADQYVAMIQRGNPNLTREQILANSPIWANAGATATSQPAPATPTAAPAGAVSSAAAGTVTAQRAATTSAQTAAQTKAAELEAIRQRAIAAGKNPTDAQVLATWQKNQTRGATSGPLWDPDTRVRSAPDLTPAGRPAIADDAPSRILGTSRPVLGVWRGRPVSISAGERFPVAKTIAGGQIGHLVTDGPWRGAFIPRHQAGLVRVN